ncbi:hypothetical protein OZZ08_13695, partial [Malaciobacter mytili]|uniref:hypothetical protein n=1 Tax=Malaciobacter mytili TaxID=603050 RepID=UPI003BB0F9DB
MLKGMLKGQVGEAKILELNKNLVLDLSEKEQFFIDNSEGINYKINLIDNDKSIQIVFETNPQISIVLNNIVNLISTKDCVLGIINTKEGLDELNQTVLNPNFEGDNIIASLKKLLSTSSLGEDIKDGIIIDDFASLTTAIEVTAAGNSIKADTSTFKNYAFDTELSNNVLFNERTRIDEEPIVKQEKSEINTSKKEEIVITEESVVKAVLSATSSVSEDGGSITYTVNLVDENGNPAVAKEDVVIT